MVTDTKTWTCIASGVWLARYRVPMFESACVALFLGPECAGSTKAPGTWVLVSPGPSLLESFAQELCGEQDKVAALIVPSSYHTMGILPFQRAYPKAKVLAAAGAHARLQSKGIEASDNLDISDFCQGDVQIGLHPAPNTRNGELWVGYARKDSRVLVVGDAMFNLPPGGSIGLRLFKFFMRAGPGLAMDLPYRFLFLRDKAAFQGWARQLVQTLGPKQLVPMHGRVLEDPELTPAFGRVMAALG